MNYILVGLGGVFGAISRYAVSKAVAEKTGTTFPVGTWVVNITGAFLLSLLLGFVAHRGILGQEMELAFTTGFLEAYTTFPTFSYETVQLVQDGKILCASGYVPFTL